MPGAGPAAASSLYSGIFNEEETSAGPTASNTQEAGRPQGEDKQELDKGLQESKASESGPLSTSAAAKPQAWSAALRFAPRKNVNTLANKAKRPPASAFISSAFSSASASQEVENDALPSKSIAQPIQAANTPALTSTSTAKAWNPVGSLQGGQKQGVQIDALQTNLPDTDTRTSLPQVLAPPELSISVEELEKDKKLFAALAEKRGEGKQGQQQYDHEWQEDGEDEDVNGFANTKEGRKARKKKSKRKRNASPGHHGGLSASLRMDADYDVRAPNDYNECKEIMRKRREAIKAIDALRREEGNSDREGEEYVSESDEEEDAFRRSKMGRFAPPAIYNQAPQHNPSFRPPAPPLPDFDDDDEKPYLSRSPSPAPQMIVADVPANPKSMSGEEAYQRRLAMSQSHSQAQSMPSIPEQVSSNDLPKAQALPDLAARAAAAAAIAARLAKAAPIPSSNQEEKVGQSSIPSFVSSNMQQQQEDAGSFAERLMTKQGWKKGEALGAEGNKGILDPILAEKVEAERRKQRYGGDSSSFEKPLHSNRGTLINPQEEERRREERRKYGNPSEVILLENMVDLAEIDDELNGEIGEECAKHGYVQRVFIWPNGPKGVRIFVKFSGMAGAWRCVKELEGRFFGGKTVRARYYPLQDFERGDYMNLYE